MIADVGTGGGFPGIPLAILFPECGFTLIDSIGKKVRVAQDVAVQIGLKNVICRHERAEEDKDRYEFILSRGVMPLPDLCAVAGRMIDRRMQRNAYPNGVICLKGGDLEAETAKYRKVAEITEIGKYFSEEFFNDKKVVYVQI
jgi:16S rRNA (guanine527-N7)-methyltransferase